MFFKIIFLKFKYIYLKNSKKLFNGRLTNFNPLLTNKFYRVNPYICSSMKLAFFKYQGTGNDFIMIDNRLNHFPKKNPLLVKNLCDRHFGIGADGLILLENHSASDFKMVYFNSDGNQSTMCGNGGRCIVAFAHQLGIVKTTTTFMAIDGLHYAMIDRGSISLQMSDVKHVTLHEHYCFLDTGSPHHVQVVDHISKFPVEKEGKRIRDFVYGKEGCNINFVTQLSNNQFKIRTYERGVEGETLACGTGATAVAIAMYETKATTAKEIIIEVEGGTLAVSFKKNQEKYTNIFLKGPAKHVYEGIIEI